MAAAVSTPTKKRQARILYDVDNTLTVAATGLNRRLLIVAAIIENALKIQGYEVASHLFTARQLFNTIEYAYIDHKAMGAPINKLVVLLSNLLEALKRLGLSFRDEDASTHVLQIYDALEGWRLGDFYAKEYLALERLIQDWKGGASAFIEALDTILDLPKDTRDLWAIKAKFEELIEVESDGFYHKFYRQDSERMEAVHGQTGSNSAKVKLPLLAKVLKTYGTETLYFWIDDRKDLYDAALKETKIKVGDESLSVVVKRCVVFIHEEPAEERTLEDYSRLLRSACAEIAAVPLELLEKIDEMIKEYQAAQQTPIGSGDIETSCCYEPASASVLNSGLGCAAGAGAAAESSDLTGGVFVWLQQMTCGGVSVVPAEALITTPVSGAGSAAAASTSLTKDDGPMIKSMAEAATTIPRS